MSASISVFFAILFFVFSGVQSVPAASASASQNISIVSLEAPAPSRGNPSGDIWANLDKPGITAASTSVSARAGSMAASQHCILCHQTKRPKQRPSTESQPQTTSHRSV